MCEHSRKLNGDEHVTFPSRRGESPPGTAMRDGGMQGPVLASTGSIHGRIASSGDQATMSAPNAVAEQLAHFMAPSVFSLDECRRALRAANHQLDAAALLLIESQNKEGRPSGDIDCNLVSKRDRKRSSDEGGAPKGSLSTWLGLKRPESTAKADDGADLSPAIERSPRPALPNLIGKPAKRIRVSTPAPPRKSYLEILQSNATQPAAASTKAPPRPPSILSTPHEIAKHLPTISLEDSPLDGAFAARLYLSLMEEAKQWSTYKWYMNDRLVESSHTSCFYRLHPSPAQYCKARSRLRGFVRLATRCHRLRRAP